MGRKGRDGGGKGKGDRENGREGRDRTGDGTGRGGKGKGRRRKGGEGLQPQTSIPGADCNGLGLDYITLQQTAETLCSCWSYSEVSSFSTLSSFGVKTACEIIATL